MLEVILSTSAEIPGLLKAAVTIMAVIAPLALVPMTFRWAGGAIAAIGGAVNNWRSGIMQNARKRASDRTSAKRAATWQRARNEEMVRGDSARKEKFNRLVRRITNPRTMLPEGRFRGWMGGGKARGDVAMHKALAAGEEYKKLQDSRQTQDIRLMRALHQGKNPRDTMRWADEQVASGLMKPEDRDYIRDNLDRIRPAQSYNSGREAGFIASTIDGYTKPQDWAAIPEIAGSYADTSRIVHGWANRQKRLRGTQSGFVAKWVRGKRGKKEAAVGYDTKLGDTYARETHQADMTGLKTDELRNDALTYADTEENRAKGIVGQTQYYEPGEVQVEDVREVNGKKERYFRPIREDEKGVYTKQSNDWVDPHTKEMSRVNLTDRFVSAASRNKLAADGITNPDAVRMGTIRGIANSAQATWSYDPVQRGYLLSSLKRIRGDMVEPAEMGTDDDGKPVVIKPAKYVSKEAGEVSDEESIILDRYIRAIEKAGDDPNAELPAIISIYGMFFIWYGEFWAAYGPAAGINNPSQFL